MPATELPQGRYLSCALRVTTDSGGQTRALLLRNRIFAIEGGVRPDVLTLGAAPDYEERRQLLLERGLLIEQVGLLNIYEHYRERGWGECQPTGKRLADLSAHRIREEQRPDGSPWRIAYRPPDSRLAVYDYLRADGSPYLRMPAFGLTALSSGRGTIQQVGADGAVVGELESAAQWFRRWIRELVGDDDRAFVFMDSRFVVPHIVPMRGRRFHLIYQMHNLHLAPPFRWNSKVLRAYRRVLTKIGGMDAMVTLTERQRDDIAERKGRTSNLFVIPNPVTMPAPRAAAPPRDPRRVAILARLEPQKRLTDAIAAFAQVVAALPDARLDIYGDGSERDRLQAEIDRRRLGGAVTLRGFDPQAGEALWTASAFLMTSSFEGYPLSTIESMSRGCPVVSYDIKYGPREQIADGDDGFLVPPGDVDQLGRRVIELLESPELVAKMSAAARRKAERFGPAEFLANWASVMQAVIERKQLRTAIDEIGFGLTGLRPARLRRVQLEGILRVRGRSSRSELNTAAVELAAIDDASGAVTRLPVKAKLAEGGEFRVRARFKDVPGARLRLRFTWQNSAWETEIVRPASETAPRSGARARAPA
jgi:poly(glycerol-phosphate) alpha-glucosyltransferase